MASANERLWVRAKLIEARLATEVVRLTPMIDVPDGVRWRDGHAAHRVYDLGDDGVLMVRHNVPCVASTLADYFTYCAGFASNFALHPFEQK